MKRTVFALAVCVLVVATLPGSASADEGFFARFNPMRFFRAPIAEENIEQHQSALRSKLEERGIDPELIDERLAHVAEARQPGVRPDFARGKSKPTTAEELRVQLEERGWDAEKIDARIARIAEMRETTNTRRQGFEPPSTESIEARLNNRGLDAGELKGRMSGLGDVREKGKRGNASRRDSQPFRGRR